MLHTPNLHTQPKRTRPRESLVLEAPVQTLYVCEDALPVRLLHHDHIVHIQQGHHSSTLVGHPKGQLEVVTTVLRLQRIEVECVGEEVVDEGAEGKTVVPTRAEVLDFYSLVAPGPTLRPQEDHVAGAGLEGGRQRGQRPARAEQRQRARSVRSGRLRCVERGGEAFHGGLGGGGGGCGSLGLLGAFSGIVTESFIE